MNKNKIEKALTQGLLAGYGGETKFEKTTRGSFDISSSHFENNEIIYHDEWTKGGGQEIVKIDGELFTRVYGGGTVNKDVLDNLGTKKEEIINYLISKIRELGDKTRLFSECKADKIGDWSYEYKVLDKENKIDVTVGKEIIKYKEEVVFVHCFVLSPIK